DQIRPDPAGEEQNGTCRQYGEGDRERTVPRSGRHVCHGVHRLFEPCTCTAPFLLTKAPVWAKRRMALVRPSIPRPVDAKDTPASAKPQCDTAQDGTEPHPVPCRHQPIVPRLISGK